MKQTERETDRLFMHYSTDVRIIHLSTTSMTKRQPEIPGSPGTPGGPGGPTGPVNPMMPGLPGIPTFPEFPFSPEITALLLIRFLLHCPSQFYQKKDKPFFPSAPAGPRHPGFPMEPGSPLGPGCPEIQFGLCRVMRASENTAHGSSNKSRQTNEILRIPRKHHQVSCTSKLFYHGGNQPWHHTFILHIKRK